MDSEPGRTSTVATSYSEQPDRTTGAGRCELLVIDGPDAGRACPVRDEPIVVGTSETCELQLTDKRVSRRHLLVEATQKGFLVKDLNSRNGTLFEGGSISELTVGAGATFRLGRSFIRIEPQPRALEVEPSQARRLGEMVAESLAMREVFAILELVAGSDVTVLLEGETGTGKELAARVLHEGNARRAGPFVAVDCGALPPGLLESELFGHRKGAFTGAENSRLGAFARADGGSLFLDELDSVPAEVQALLIRAIEERRVRPLGADEEREVDVRFIAASQRDLASRVADGSFRADLYYRLSVVRVCIPPLRQRREDLVPLVKALLQARGFDAGQVDGPGLDRLHAHDWPGNVRELRNVLDRALALRPDALGFGDLPMSLNPDGSGPALTVRTDLSFGEAKETLVQAFERHYLRDLLARCEGNISAAARAADMDRKHLRKLLRRHGLIPE